MGEATSTDRIIYAIAQMSLSSRLNMHVLKLDEGATVQLFGDRTDGVLSSVTCKLKFDRDDIYYGRIFDLTKRNWKDQIKEFVDTHLESEKQHESFKS